jgi:acetoin utilization deacetylase AcuC-like enzyme
MTATGFAYDDRFLQHDTGNAALVLEPNELLEADQHIESPTRIRRTVQLLERSGLADQLQRLPCRAATIEEVTAYHRPEYVRAVADFARRGGGYIAPSTPVGTTSYDIALLAVGGGLCAVQAVLQGDVTRAYAMLRPPGHHALADQAMGFCLLNNIAVAAKLARQRWGVARVAIVDWDVHHGNGTQAAFYDDPSVLFISLHQANLFPVHSGLLDETGEGEGRGYTVNIPLPAGTGDAGYRYAFERVVEPVLEQFAPQVILVSAGQDPSKYDPLGRMCVSAAGFRVMATTVRRLADRLCGGRLILFQEGGYSHVYIPFATLAILEAVCGINTGVSDPFRPAHDTLADWQRQAVDAVVTTQRQFWKMS